jgi:hypothetical protein
MTDMKHDDRELSAQAIASKLRNLPHAGALPYEWAEFRARSDQRRDLRRRAAGIAACFAVIIAGLAVWTRLDGGSSAMNELAKSEETSSESSAQTPPLNNEDSTASAHARDAAQWLASLPSEPTVVRIDTRFAVTDLEDRIAWLDDLLSAVEVERVRPDHISTLRRERAQLVDSLAQVRYAETLAAELP